MEIWYAVGGLVWIDGPVEQQEPRLGYAKLGDARDAAELFDVLAAAPGGLEATLGPGVVFVTDAEATAREGRNVVLRVWEPAALAALK